MPASVLSMGMPTHPDGSEEIAWPVTLADTILEITHESGLAIVGGDIYTKKETRLKPAYDNWCTDIEYGEKWTSYMQRSYLEASEYLKSYWIEKDSWFVLVVVDKADAMQLVKSYVR